MNNEPVAWHYPSGTPEQCTTNKEYAEMEPAWIPMYYHPAKTLTSEEIEAEWFKVFEPEAGLGKNLTNGIFEFARAILKKASDK
jgi:hypothetical protein